MSSHTSRKLEDHLAAFLVEVGDSADAKTWINGFLTDEEQIMLTKRLAMHAMLKEGYAPTDIAIMLHVTRETVRTHMLRWNVSNAQYKRLIGRFTKNDSPGTLAHTIRQLWTQFDLARRANTNMKARAKLMNGG